MVDDIVKHIADMPDDDIVKYLLPEIETILLARAEVWYI
jgi:hypothetical protein